MSKKACPKAKLLLVVVVVLLLGTGGIHRDSQVAVWEAPLPVHADDDHVLGDAGEEVPQRNNQRAGSHACKGHDESRRLGVAHKTKRRRRITASREDFLITTPARYVCDLYHGSKELAAEIDAAQRSIDTAQGLTARWT
jgi:hypothetical protein